MYLPPGYQSAKRRYPAIYMQDGQNLFDPAKSFAGDWGLMDGAGLPRRGVEAIIVGIPNMGEERIAEYSPYVDAEAGGGKGDDYLDFVVDTVKPLVDRSFRTLPGRETTGLGGSSMGGLISLYGFFARPGDFGFVASLSPALWFADRAIFPFIETAPRVPGKIYLDIGTNEGASTLANARRMREILLAKGYREGEDLRWVEEPGAGHTEAAWGRRFKAALPFLVTSQGTHP